MKQQILHYLHYIQGRLPVIATRADWYMALSYAVRERMMDEWINAIRMLADKKVKFVAYLSAEFLMGPQLGSNILNLGIRKEVEAALTELGQSLEDLLEQEPEPGLGNGGLGRLAACYLDSMATLRIPSVGYGIRYEFGMFEQAIVDGWQVERTDEWLSLGNPWQIVRPEISYKVFGGGHTEYYKDENGATRVRWIPGRVVKGVACDTFVSGYRSGIASVLRLWKSEAVEEFDFQEFNLGNYYDAVDEKVFSETISKVLYPNDEPEMGKLLRLWQQYFFVSCSLQDMIRLHLLRGNPINTFHESFAVQLNDTHPSIGVAELMRLLLDVYNLGWEEAWEVTTKTFCYTNHTLLPEALEKWPVPIFAQILPRHLEIIYEINRRFLEGVRATYPGDEQRAARMSLIDERHQKYVRMAHLATVGGHAVNGVAELHSELLKSTTLRDFHEYFPERFHNVTNGVTPRRWLALSNPEETELICSRIGDKWLSDERELRKLERFAEDAEFRAKWREVKQTRKRILSSVVKERTGIEIAPNSMFDMQVKRIHEYKRQLLNVLHVITLYNRIRNNTSFDVTPRTVLFGGKSAPGYFMAKRIIKLITSVARVIAADAAVSRKLKVVFFPNFNVKNGEMIYPAADLSEQISTAGYEASGTGNMKFSFNGALTIGTLDGANIEVREEVGADNFFLFGLRADQVMALKSSGYNPRAYYENNPVLREIVDQIASGIFSDGDRELFRPIVDSLLNSDPYLVMADYEAYVACQDEVGRAYQDGDQWSRMSILNVARMGKFSSDRSVREYCQNIWNVKPLRLAPKKELRKVRGAGG